MKGIGDMNRLTAFLAAAAAVALFGIGSLHAQESTASGAAPVVPAKALSIELNKTANSGAGCRLTFVAKNDTGAPLDKASYEIAVFDANNQVARLLIFEFGSLAIGKTKVVEFEYPSLACNGISRILVNTSPECVSEGAASPVCLNDLKTSTLSTVAFDQ